MVYPVQVTDEAFGRTSSHTGRGFDEGVREVRGRGWGDDQEILRIAATSIVRPCEYGMESVPKLKRP